MTKVTWIGGNLIGNSMQNEHQIKFRVYLKEEYDRIVDDLLTISKDWTPEQISKHVSGKFSLTFIPGMSLEPKAIKAFPFYRIRVWNEGNGAIDESNPSSFSYPPSEYIKMGRANRDGMQVLYGSGDANTPFHELAKDIELGKSMIYLTKWAIKPEAENTIMRSLFYGIPFEGKKGYAAIMARALNEGIKAHFGMWQEEVRNNFLYGQKKYNELFCVETNEYYHITSAMVYNHFITDSDKEVEMPIIAYPSVAKKKNSVNFVVKKEFVDKYMYIKEIQKIIVRELKGDVKATLLSKGFLENGKIKWQSIVAKLDMVDYNNAKLIFNNNPSTIQNIKAEDKITTCCINHGMTLKQFFEKSKISDERIMKEFNSTNLGNLEANLPKQFHSGIVAPTKGNVYLTNAIDENKKISHFLVPFTYTLNFQ